MGLVFFPVAEILQERRSQPQKAPLPKGKNNSVPRKSCLYCALCSLAVKKRLSINLLFDGADDAARFEVLDLAV